MLAKNTDVYLLIPSQGRERVLHQGLVLEVTPQAFVAKFVESLPLVVNANVFAHCEVNRKFMQQAAAVQAILKTEPDYVVAFNRTGEPISAESRGSYRVSCAGQKLYCKINGDSKCQLVDTSSTGFGAVATEGYLPGDEVDVTLFHEMQSFTGRARVMSARTVSGKCRYGLHAIEPARGEFSQLIQGLAVISAANQRMQLRRLARA